MSALSRRDFLKLSGGAVLGLVAMGWPVEWRLLQPLDVLNPLAAYPNRDWERVYRDQYRYDSSFTFVCSPNDTHACRLRAFVRNGVILRSETNYDVERYSDLYGNKATAHWHPRGCKKGQTFHRRVYGPHRLKGPLMRKGWKEWADDGFPLLTPENQEKYKFTSRGTDELMPVDWDTAYRYIAKGMVAIARRYSGFVCMGQQGGNVNIWHWKADWQAALVARRTLQAAHPNIYVDYYPFAEADDNLYAAAYADTTYLTAEAAGNLLAMPVHASPVEDLVAGGFGTLTSQPAAAQNVQGYGVWQNGVWRVIFSRGLRSNESDDIVLTPDQVYAVAFAAWDGANGERNGAKATSQWVSLQFGAAAAPTAPAAPEAPSAPAPMGLPLWAWIILGVLGLLILLGGLFALLLPDRT